MKIQIKEDKDENTNKGRAKNTVRSGLVKGCAKHGIPSLAMIAYRQYIASTSHRQTASQVTWQRSLAEHPEDGRRPSDRPAEAIAIAHKY